MDRGETPHLEVTPLTAPETAWEGSRPCIPSPLRAQLDGDPEPKRREKRVTPILLITITLIAAIVGVALLTTTTRIPTTGKIKTVNLECYQDSNLATPLTQIDWGTLEPGEEKNYTFWLLNTGNTPLNITVSTEAWNPPETQQHINLAYNGPTILQSNETRQAALNLQVSPTIEGIDQFNFTIVLEGKG